MHNKKQLQLSDAQLMKASCSCLIVFLVIIIYKNWPINEGKHIICNLNSVSTCLVILPIPLQILNPAAHLNRHVGYFSSKTHNCVTVNSFDKSFHSLL